MEFIQINQSESHAFRYRIFRVTFIGMKRNFEEKSRGAKRIPQNFNNGSLLDSEILIKKTLG